jgi:hypothetical protein
MISTFPSTASYINGASINYADSLLVNTFEDGLSRQARQYRRRLLNYSVNYLICDLCAFQDWVTTDLCHGADYFLWVNPFCKKKTVRARIKEGQVSYKQLSNQLDRFEASMIIETWEF